MQVIELDYAPYDYQSAIHLVVDAYGKSKMALMELIKHCLEVPKANAWWVAPTINMAREIRLGRTKRI